MSTTKVIEPVPRSFTLRVGDWAQEGSNNTLIVLGTDRAANGPATIDDGLGTVEADGGGRGAGSITIVAGRQDPDGNPDQTSDDAFIYLSQRTNADDNLGTGGIVAKTKNQPAFIAKSTDIRLGFGGPDGTGCFKLYLDDVDMNRYIYIDGGLMQLSISDDTTVSLVQDTIEVRVASNVIHVDRDGSVSIVTDSRVNVKTKTVVVNCDTAEITGDVTLDKTLHVQGAVTMGETLSVAGDVSAAGASFNGSVTANGEVSGNGKNLSTHTHPITGVSAGTSAVVSGPPS